MSDPHAPKDPFNKPPPPQPTKNDIGVLDLLVKRVREAAKLRHDFQKVASLNARERQLRPPVFESELAKASKSPPFPDLLARHYDSVAADAASLVDLIENPELKDLLRGRLFILFPKIGFDPADPGKPVRHMPGPGKGVLDKIHPHRGDELIVLLQQLPIKVGPYQDKWDPRSVFYW